MLAEVVNKERRRVLGASPEVGESASLRPSNQATQQPTKQPSNYTHAMTAPVVLRSSSPFRTEVEAGPHRWIMDEPESAGGGNEGPTPYDMLAAALGGCTVMTLHFYARREKLPLEEVTVRVSHDRQHAKDCADCVTTGGFIHRFRVEIAMTGALTEEQKQKLFGVAARCPVARTLQAEIKVDEVLVDAI